jgi:uncharacterized protein YdeI (YjbR/CyaY-like superfamily)
MYNHDMQHKHFASPAAFRAWLEKNHNKEKELWVAYYKKSSGKKSMTYLEAVDVALCYGWIDGVGRSIDNESYSNRYTPRKPRSIWSLRNVGRVAEMEKLGLMTDAGRAAFTARSAERTGVYSAENRHKSVLDPAAEKLFKANKKAWAFFQAQTENYRKTAIWIVISAKQEATRKKRLQTLIRDSAAGRKLRQLTRTPKKKS